MDRHKADNIMIGIRSRKAWVARVDAHAKKHWRKSHGLHSEGRRRTHAA